MIIHFDKTITKNNPQLLDFVEGKSIWYPIYYVLDSRVRTAVNLQKWFADIVANPSKELIAVADSIKTNADPDYTITDILRWVQKNIKYVPDQTKWSTPELWQPPDITLQIKQGDCEDGAILIAALAHYKGIPSNRWLINCGSVIGGGHAYFAYRPTEYPLNWVFMDWCYWFDKTSPSARTKYYINDTTIYDDPKNQYLKIWFAFNEKTSHKGIMNVA